MLVSWLQADCPVFSEGEDQHSVLQAAALATKWWEPARDALDTMVLEAAKLHELAGFQHTDFVPFDPAVKVQPLPCLPITGHLLTCAAHAPCRMCAWAARTLTILLSCLHDAQVSH